MMMKKPVSKTNKKFLKQNDIRRYSRYASKGAVFAEKFNITIRKMLTKPVFEDKYANWIDGLEGTIKKCNIAVHHSSLMTPVNSWLKIIEKKFHHLKSKRKKRKL